MRIRLLTAMKVRNADGGHVILNPGIYDSESSDFPEALRNESRADVVKFLDSPVVPGNPVTEMTSDSDPDDEDNSDLDEEMESEEESEEEEETRVERKKKKKKRI